MLRIFSLCAFLTFSSAATHSTDKADDDYLNRMQREHAADSPIASAATKTEPASEVSSKDVDYVDIDGDTVAGYLSTPVDGKSSAGIIVIHEWWGLNDNIRAMTERLAGEGYTALAVDLYEGEVAETREDALRLARGSSDKADRLEKNLRGAWTFLKEDQGVAKIGVVGWCFGGGWSLRTALLLGDDVDAAVIYYGRLATDRKTLAALESPVLGLFGALDEGIPVTTVREFQGTLDSLGKDATIHIYEGAHHAFANPSGTRYDEGAAIDAWAKTLIFYAENLR